MVIQKKKKINNLRKTTLPVRRHIFSSVSDFLLYLVKSSLRQRKAKIIGCHLALRYATYLVLYLFNSFIYLFLSLYQLNDVKVMSWRKGHVLIMARHTRVCESGENEWGSWTVDSELTMKWLILISAFFEDWLGNNKWTYRRFFLWHLTSYICIFVCVRRVCGWN